MAKDIWMSDVKGKLCDYCIYEPDWKLHTKSNGSVVGECDKLKKKISCYFNINNTKEFVIENFYNVKIWNSFEECDHFEEKEKIRI